MCKVSTTQTLEQHDEINQLISKPMAVSDWTDEDIEAELNDLVANQEAEKQLSDLSSLFTFCIICKNDLHKEGILMN